MLSPWKIDSMLQHGTRPFLQGVLMKLGRTIATPQYTITNELIKDAWNKAVDENFTYNMKEPRLLAAQGQN